MIGCPETSVNQRCVTSQKNEDPIPRRKPEITRLIVFKWESSGFLHRARYICSDDLEGSGTSLFRETKFGSGGYWSDRHEEMCQVYRKVARIVANQRAPLGNRRISPSKSLQHPLESISVTLKKKAANSPETSAQTHYPTPYKNSVINEQHLPDRLWIFSWSKLQEHKRHRAECSNTLWFMLGKMNINIGYTRLMDRYQIDKKQQKCRKRRQHVLRWTSYRTR